VTEPAPSVATTPPDVYVRSLPKGGNPWGLTADYLKEKLGREPTENETWKEWNALLERNGYATPIEMDIYPPAGFPERYKDKKMPQDFQPGEMFYFGNQE
jgi:hypothetical protein